VADVQELLREALRSHGYWVLFIWTFLEGEAGLILAGFFAFQGYMTLPGVMLTAWGGAFLGDQFYFYLGRRHSSLIIRLFTSIMKKFRKALRLIERYGTFVAFISRYTYGFRIILPVILGMSNYPGRMFFLLNLLSAALWAVIFSSLGFGFGKGASLLVEDISRYEHYLALLLAALIAVVWLGHFAHAGRVRLRALRRLARRKGRHHP
jgi:membrane protein DedA with SNARE-associated domain